MSFSLWPSAVSFDDTDGKEHSRRRAFSEAFPGAPAASEAFPGAPAAESAEAQGPAKKAGRQAGLNAILEASREPASANTIAAAMGSSGYCSVLASPGLPDLIAAENTADPNAMSTSQSAEFMPIPGARPKTRLCLHWEQGGDCTRGKACWFAHGPEELQIHTVAPGVDVPMPGSMQRMCNYWLQGLCKRGNDCWYAHSSEELAQGGRKQERNGVPATTRMDFSGLEAGQVSKMIKVPDAQVEAVMTSRARELLMHVAGLSAVKWDRSACKATFIGTAKQVEQAAQVLQRVTTHCHWGVSEIKVNGLLQPRLDCTSARIILAPMVPQLKKCEVMLSTGKPILSIGTDPSNHLVVKGPLLSRKHAQLEFESTKGAVYIVDLSTNGTFMNGRQLPAKASAKVVVWHGDELLFQDPAASGGSEFGYVVNLELV